MNDKYQAFPATFLNDFFAKIFKVISLGESAIILGPSGSGKTYFFQILEGNKKIKNRHLPKVPLEFKCIDAGLEIDNHFQINPEVNTVFLVDHAEFLDSIKHQVFLNTINALRRSGSNRVSIILNYSGNFDELSKKIGKLLPAALENIFYMPSFSNNKLTGGFPRLDKLVQKLESNYLDDLAIQQCLNEIIKFKKFNPKYQYTCPLLEKYQKHEDKEIIADITFSQKLTRQEINLVKLLLGYKNQIVSREEMMESVWPKAPLDVNEHALDQLIHRVRQKFSTASPKVKLEVIKGRGVRLST